MRSPMKTLSHSLLAVIALFIFLQSVEATLTLKYCSLQNTGSNNPDTFDIYQSYGACSEKCQGDYAFGIVLKNDCWCSNEIPEDQHDLSECDLNCPGFPDDKCGNEDKDLYGYIPLIRRPSGTQFLPRPTSASIPIQSSTSTSTPTPTSTSSPSPIPSSVSSQESSSVIPSTFRTSVLLTTIQTQLSTAVEVITVSNKPVTQSVIKTIVITPSATPIAETKHKSVSTGAIVGGILGGLAGLLAIVGGVFFLLWRRRRQQQDDDGQTGIQRNVSTMSKSGLLRFGQANSQVTQHPSKISTAFNRHSRIPHEEEISPMSAPDRRNSRPYLFDQRLNPSAIMNLDNNSRGSFVSLDDSHDYGRTLNVRNPDPVPPQYT